MLAYEISRQPAATDIGLCISTAHDYCAGTAKRAPFFMCKVWNGYTVWHVILAVYGGTIW